MIWPLPVAENKCSPLLTEYAFYALNSPFGIYFTFLYHEVHQNIHVYLSWTQTDPLIQKASGMISQSRRIYSTQTKRWVITVGRFFFPSYTYSGMTYLSNGLLVIYLRNNTFIESIILSCLLHSSDLLYISPPEFLSDCTKKIKNDAFVKQQH